jgi:hypothetical protein
VDFHVRAQANVHGVHLPRGATNTWATQWAGGEGSLTAELEGLFVANQVDVSYYGHIHSYNRMYPVKHNGSWVDNSSYNLQVLLTSFEVFGGFRVLCSFCPAPSGIHVSNRASVMCTSARSPV